MMMTRRLPSRLFASAALAIAGGAGAVHAQSQATSPASGAAAVTEVVVTAEKRTERLQEVAASVGVVSGATLERMQATSLEDWAGYVPGLTVADQGAPGESSIAIDGIGPIGAASALKLSYAGITKGLTAIGAAMILAAERMGAGPALKQELAASQPQILARLSKSLPDMYPKAYRWVDEMRFIAEFVGATFPEAGIFDGAAGLYQRLAKDVAGAGKERTSLNVFLAR